MSNTYDLNTVKRHNKMNDCWIVIDDNVIDATKFLHKHPVGGDIILEHAGTDATDIFNKVGHGNDAYELMLTYKIGTLIRPTVSKNLVSKRKWAFC